MTITKEMIFEAADSLVEAGKKPKVAAVRKMLGKGSFTTIIEAMQEWRESQKTPETPVHEVAPQIVMDRVETLGNEIWKVAVELANESLSQEREALKLAKMDMEEQQEETAEMADELANEIEVLRAKNEELTGFLKIEKETHHATQHSLQLETDKCVKLSAELNAANKRIEDLKEETRSTRSLIDQANKDRERMIERELKQNSDITRLEGTIQSMKEQHTRESEHVAVHVDRAEQERDIANEERRNAQEAAQAARVEAAKLAGELESLKKQVSQQAKMFESLAANMKPTTQTKKPAQDGEK